YAWLGSAGRPATPTAKKVRSAATRSVPECAASESRPRLWEGIPAASLIAISAQAASTETSAVRRWGVTGEASPKRRARRGGLFVLRQKLRRSGVCDVTDEDLVHTIQPTVDPVVVQKALLLLALGRVAEVDAAAC